MALVDISTRTPQKLRVLRQYRRNLAVSLPDDGQGAPRRVAGSVISPDGNHVVPY
jgi:hypothetical protein